MVVVADSSDLVGQWVADSEASGQVVDLESLVLPVVDHSPSPSHIRAAAGHNPCRSQELHRAGRGIHEHRQDLGIAAVVGTDLEVVVQDIRTVVVGGREAEGRGTGFAVAEVAGVVRDQRTSGRLWSAL